MKKRNKKYKPRTVVMNPLNYFLGGLKKIDCEHLTELNIKNHLSMSAICTGNGTKDHFDRLVGMQNMALVLNEMHFSDEYLSELLQGKEALHRLGERFRKHNKFVMTGDEMQSINRTISIHEAQLTALRVIDVERAYDEVQRRLKYGVNVQKIGVAA